MDIIRQSINEKTKIIYCESISNPLLEVANIPELRKIADEFNLKLIVDNTFSPMIIAPYKLGAHIVVYSLTKFINGMNDAVAGAVCADHDFIASLRNVNNGSAMLLGPTLDPIRASMIMKNLHTLHVRLKQHSRNAMYIAENLEKLNFRVFYPGLPSHPQHKLMKSIMNPNYGFGGMITFDVKTQENAQRLMEKMQELKVGYFAVSLGFYKTLFSSPGSSTSSEIPPEEQEAMGMTPGLVRFSVGLDDDIEETFSRIKQAIDAVL